MIHGMGSDGAPVLGPMISQPSVNPCRGEVVSKKVENANLMGLLEKLAYIH